METENKADSIDLMDLIMRFRRYWVMIVLCGFLFGGAAFAYCKFFVTPQYEASCRMIVITREDMSANVTQDQLSSAQGMIDTYTQIILGRDFLEKVIDEMGYSEEEMSYAAFRNKISISGVSSTQIMKIAVRDPDVNTAKAIARIIYATAPDYTKEKGRIGSLEQLDRVHAESKAVYPNVKRNTLLALLIGLLIPLGVITVQMLIENTYKTDADVKRDLNLPVLGVIPVAEDADAKRGSKRKTRSSSGKGAK